MTDAGETAHTPGPGDKRSTRRALRLQRRTIAGGRDLESDAATITGHVLPLLPEPTRLSAPTVLSYESLPHEPPTHALNGALRDAGWRVLVPITLESFDLDWHALGDPTPLGVDEATTADAAVIPGLAVDPFGTRLGQGGGCYDRVLPRLRDNASVVLLLHPGEIYDGRLPREAHDRPVQVVVTADGPVRL